MRLIGKCVIEAVEPRLLLSRTIYVDGHSVPGPRDGSAWANAYSTLSPALAAAAAGDTIRVADGIYASTSIQLKDGVEILGGFAGHAAADPNARDLVAFPSTLWGDSSIAHIINGSGTSATAVVDGFLIASGGVANTPGGGLYNAAGSPTIRNCTFDRFGVTSAVANEQNASPTLIDCRFTSNSGGALVNNNSSPSLTGCTFEGNTLAVSNSSSNPTFTDCAFTSNFRRAVTNTSSNPSFTNCSFTSHFSGAISNTSSSPIITGCTFTSNATSSSSGNTRGGAIFNTTSSSPSIIDCTFFDNSATEGGAIYTTGSSSVTIDRCVFTRNRATNSVGGAVSTFSATQTITNSTFNANSASISGGAVSQFAAYTTLTNCVFVGNIAGTGGGFSSTESPKSLTITNCTFVANSASRYGGGVQSSAGSITNSIVWGNDSPVSASIFSTGSLSVSYSDVQGGAPGAGVVDVDPQFVRNPSPGADGKWATDDDDYGDLRLRAFSPLVDAGNNGALSGITTDITGATRFRDVPTTPDSGIGTAPIVDLGAYEALPALAAGAGTIYTVAAGSEVQLRGYGASDSPGTLQYAWEWSGNNAFDDATGAAPVFSAVGRMAGSTVMASLRVTDGAARSTLVSVPIHIVAPIIYVDQNTTSAHDGRSWATAYLNLQDALDEAVSGQTIRVADGNYSTRYDASGSGSLLKNGVRLEGGYGGFNAIEPDVRDQVAHPTFLYPIGTPAIIASNNDASAVLDGFTISGASGSQWGTAMRITGGSPTIVNCTFAENSTSDSSSSMGNVYVAFASPTFVNCIFTCNSGPGAAMFVDAFASVAMINCTVTQNKDSFYGAALMVENAGELTLTNCIVWDNTTASGGQFTVGSTGQLLVSFSDVQGGAAGTGNVNVDPQFVRPAQFNYNQSDLGDLRLKPTSPLIDVGSNAAVPAGVDADAAGNVRIDDTPGVHDPGSIVEMGAYEHARFRVREGAYNPNTPSPMVSFVLSADLQTTSQAPADLVLRNLTTNQMISAATMNVQYDGATRSARWLFNSVLPDGNYRATLASGALADTADRALALSYSFDFFVLGGDANHDRVVDTTDLGALSLNWNRSRMQFRQGDFNYDGNVDVGDLKILSANWQKSLPAPGPSPAAPTSLTAMLSGTQINLNWVDQSSNENGFTLERKTGAGGTWAKLKDVAAGATSASDTTATAGNTYFYRVYAYSDGGASDYSNEASVAYPSPVVTTYLSDLTWTAMTNGWGSVEKDKSNGEQATGDGRTITLNGVTYNKGLGTHAGSSITYALNGNYTTFLSDIGVDDEVGNAGSVVFQVYLDNVLSYTSSTLTGSSATQQVNLNVTGKQTLRLVVTDAGNGATSDHADWANARLLSGGSVSNLAPTPVVSPPPTSSSSARRTRSATKPAFVV